MTENDAANFWCPFTMAVGVSQYGVTYMGNRLAYGHKLQGESNPIRCRCIGPACAAWRWTNNDSAAGEGYCGIAGKP